MESSRSGVYDKDLENRILKIILKIKKNRNRPCFQNIHSMLERGGRNITMEDLELFIEKLIEKKYIGKQRDFGKRVY